jgi:transcriptional regulator with XRE-family HTH domain
MTETVTTPTKINKAELIRTLLKDKNKTRAQIAEEVGCSKQYVFSVQNAARVRAKKARAKRQYERKLEILNGAPKRKYTKKAESVAAPAAAPAPAPAPKKSLAEERIMLMWDRKRLKDELADAAESMLQMRQEIRDLRERPPIQIEVPVLQPFSHLTFWQRLRILFLGGAA